MQVIIRYPISLVTGGFVVGHCHSNIVGRVKPGFLTQMFYDRIDCVARIKYIIDD